MSLDDLLNAGTPPRQDFVLINGKKPPGLSIPSNAAMKLTWDKQKGWGYTGASLIYTGQDLSDFTITFVIWEKSHWKDWGDFVSVLEKPAAGKVPPALTVRHPLLNRAPIRIEKCVINEIGQWEQGETGLWTCTGSFTDWRARKPVLQKVEGIPEPKGPTTLAEFENDPVFGPLLKEQRRLGGVL